MEERILAYITQELVNNKLEVLPLKEDTSLVETGILDSLSLLKLLVFVEEEFHLLIDDLDVVPDNFSTVHDICVFIRSHQTKEVV